MKNSLLLFIVFGLILSCFAESPIFEDIRALKRAQRYDPASAISIPERLAIQKEIRERIEPIILGEFAKLADGEATPLVRELLQDPDAMGLCKAALCKSMKMHSLEIQTDMLHTVFDITPDSLRGHIVQSLFSQGFPNDVFSGDPIQEWLVEKINGGMPAGAYYFILTDESTRAVSKTAKTSMRGFSKRKGHKEQNLFSLLSAVFLASRADGDALRLLDSLLEKRDLDSLLDTAYVIPAAAMTGNDKLVWKLREIIATDTRTRWNGDDAMPSETSFAQIAASACSLVIEGFPPIGYWDDYDDEAKKRVNDWLKANPAHKIKADSARAFFRDSPFQIIPAAMSRGEETNKGK